MTLALTILAAWLTWLIGLLSGIALHIFLTANQRPQGRVVDFTRARVGDRR